MNTLLIIVYSEDATFPISKPDNVISRRDGGLTAATRCALACNYSGNAYNYSQFTIVPAVGVCLHCREIDWYSTWVQQSERPDRLSRGSEIADGMKVGVFAFLL